jgi:haloacetate dehalogenase
MGAENHDEFRAATRDPATVRAMLEDYRAGLGVDREHEEEDRRAGRTVRCPTLFLWSTRDDMERLYGDPLAVWQPWVDTLSGAGIDSGHHMAEDNPAALSAALVDFLT